MSLNETDYKTKINSYAVSLMPDKLASTVANYLGAYPEIFEIRLRINSPLTFTFSGGSLITGIICSRDDIQSTINKMTDGNYFKNEEIIRMGYITLNYGLRAGVCGDAFVSENTVKHIRRINYINIRIPSSFICDCTKILGHIKKSEFKSSIIVFSPPCQGKTTLLRSIAYALSSKPISKQVAVVDTNHELKFDLNNHALTCDFLVGYPKAYGIDLAIRYFNPEYLICDELGGYEECEKLTELLHCGVPMIASAHADSFQGLLKRKNLRSLINNNAFDTAIKIHRQNNLFQYEIKSLSSICDS